jgi:hypothetical protein
MCCRAQNWAAKMSVAMGAAGRYCCAIIAGCTVSGVVGRDAVLPVLTADFLTEIHYGLMDVMIW